MFAKNGLQLLLKTVKIRYRCWTNNMIQGCGFEFEFEKSKIDKIEKNFGFESIFLKKIRIEKIRIRIFKKFETIFFKKIRIEKNSNPYFFKNSNKKNSNRYFLKKFEFKSKLLLDSNRNFILIHKIEYNFLQKVEILSCKNYDVW